jgi:gamma-D-glutamyl-L-lysine dipeptidyl-peptidase
MEIFDSAGTHDVITRLCVSRNVANLYAKPDTNSEVVSQAVLGEFLTVDRKEGEFYLVQTDDFYSGWVRERAVVNIGGGNIIGVTYRPIAVLFAEVYKEPNSAEEIITRLPIGARVAVLPERVEAFQHIMLPDLTDGWVLRFALGTEFNLSKLRRTQWDVGSQRAELVLGIGNDAVAVGKRLIGTPYLWGGKSTFGIDCSGYTQLCYRIGAGINLLWADPRFESVFDGKSLADKPAFQNGDLLFFGTRNGRRAKVTHVGMFADGRILHSGGGIGVVWQTFDELTYASQYLGARRLSTKAKSIAPQRLIA